MFEPMRIEKFIKGILTGFIAVMVLAMAALFIYGALQPAEARGVNGRGSYIQTIEAGDSLQKFYDPSYVPDGAIEGPLVTFGEPFNITNGAWRRAGTCISAADSGYPCGILTGIWLNPAIANIYAQSPVDSQPAKSQGVLNAEIMLISFDAGYPDTLTIKRLDDTTWIGAGVTHAGFSGLQEWPSAVIANDWMDASSILRNADGTSAATYVVTTKDMGFEFTDSLQIWLRPCRQPFIYNYWSGYGSAWYMLVPDKSLLTGRRGHVWESYKIEHRRDNFPLIRVENAVPVTSFSRWWGSYSMGSWYINTRYPWSLVDFTQDSVTEHPTYADKNFMEENIYGYIDRLPVLAELDSILPGADTVWLKAPGDPLIYPIGWQCNHYGQKNNEFWMRPPDSVYDPLDTAFWATRATRYDTTGGIWKYKIANIDFADTKVRGVSQFIDGSYAWLLGNASFRHTGTEDPYSGYYGSSVFGISPMLTIPKLLTTRAARDTLCQRSWGFIDSRPRRFRTGFAVHRFNWQSRNDSVTCKTFASGVYYTKDLLAGNYPKGRCCYGSLDTACVFISELACAALGGEWFAGETCTGYPCKIRLCVYDDSSACATITADSCSALGGDWNPGIYDCADTSWRPLGGCVLNDSMDCVTTTEATCLAAGGDWTRGLDCEDTVWMPLGGCLPEDSAYCLVTTRNTCGDGNWIRGLDCEGDTSWMQLGGCVVNDSSACVIATKNTCDEAQGDWTKGYLCDDTLYVPLGKCCYNDSADCGVMMEATCLILGGEWVRGDDCSGDPCSAEPPPDTGRCCYGSQECAFVTLDSCDALSGIWNYGETCAGDPCALGRCILPDSVDCRYIIEDSCDVLLGAWTAEEDCADSSWRPLGKCCYNDSADCGVTTEITCLLLNGVWVRGGNCDGDPCAAALPDTGRCCFAGGDSCRVMDEAECLDSLGVWEQDSTCDGTPCVLGRCCYGGEACSLTTITTCNNLSGAWDAGLDCGGSTPCKMADSIFSEVADGSYKRGGGSVANWSYCLPFNGNGPTTAHVDSCIMTTGGVIADMYSNEGVEGSKYGSVEFVHFNTDSFYWADDPRTVTSLSLQCSSFCVVKAGTLGDTLSVYKYTSNGTCQTPSSADFSSTLGAMNASEVGLAYVLTSAFTHQQIKVIDLALDPAALVAGQDLHLFLALRKAHITGTAPPDGARLQIRFYDRECFTPTRPRQVKLVVGFE